MKNYFQFPPSYFCQKKEDGIVFLDYFNNLLTMDFEGSIINIEKKNDDVGDYYFSFYFIKGNTYAFPLMRPIIMNNFSEKIINFKEAKEAEYVYITGQNEKGLFAVYSDGSMFTNVNVEKKTYNYCDLFKNSVLRPITTYLGNDLYIQNEMGDLFIYDLLNDTFINEPIIDSLGVVQCMCEVGGGIIALNEDNKRIIGLKKDGSIVFKIEFNSSNKGNWKRMHRIGEKLLLLPLENTSIIYEIDMQTFEVNANNCISDLELQRTNSFMFVRYYEDEKCIIYPNRGTYAFLYLDKVNACMKWVYPQIGTKETEIYIEKIRKRVNRVILQENVLNLEDYIEIILAR